MIKVQKIIFFSLLLLTIPFYFLWNSTPKKKTIIIEPIKIAPITIKEQPKLIKVTQHANPSDILKKLKIATSRSKEKVKQSEEELVNKILSSLKQQAKQQIKIEKHNPKAVILVKKVKEKNQETLESIIKIPKIKKEEIKKYIITPIAKIENKVQVVKKVTVVKEKALPLTIEDTAKEAKDIQVSIETIKIIKLESIKVTTKSQKQLSRAEEVALYKSQYSNQLEVIGTSESFEIQETENDLPDSYYFKTQEVSKNPDTLNEPLNYVKKLGVVDISNAYEVNFSISDQYVVKPKAFQDSIPAL